MNFKHFSRLKTGIFPHKALTSHGLIALLLIILHAHQALAAIGEGVGVEESTSSAERMTTDLLDLIRGGLNGEACQTAMEASNAAAEGELPDRPFDPRFSDASIYVIQHSTDAYCISAHIAGFEAMALYSGKEFRAQKKTWENVGEVLTNVMIHPNPEIRSYSFETDETRRLHIPQPPPLTAWRVRLNAAVVLRYMGPPYQERAYQYFLDELKRLATLPNPTDEEREEAVNLIDQFYFDYPNNGPYKGFYKKVKHEPPVELFRAVNKRLDLVTFWPLYINRPDIKKSYQGNITERFLEYKHLVEAQ